MTASAPTVGLALIARDEQDTLPRLLASIEGAFDRVVLLDTGSTDHTIQVFQDWARQQTSITYSVCRYGWRDDFAHARTVADRLLLYGTTSDPDPQTLGALAPMADWTCWADCDDEIAGAQNLRVIAHGAPDTVNAFVADYDYLHDQHGNVVCRLRRERLVRAGHGVWVGRVHEAQVFAGDALRIDPGTCRWVHHKHPDGPSSSDRNLRILTAWNDDQPDDPRIVGYLGTELAGRGDHARAIGFFEQYLGLKTGWDEERCQIHRKLAVCHLAQGHPDQAITVALEALRVMPGWPDTYLTLAQATYEQGEHAKAVEWAREVLRRGMPADSMLILNPLDYTFQPRLVLAAALGALGHLEQAVQVAEEALAIVPGHPELLAARHGWQATLKREATAQTFAGCARTLAAHDEQLKALELLERCVPYYAQDHPLVVAARSEMRERLHWLRSPDSYGEHYETGGSKPEDMIPDDQVAGLCERLPRARFLAGQLREMTGELKAAA